MNHAEATSSYAAERYLLGELTDAEIEAFESHYFECGACADDVRDGQQMMEAGRDIARVAPVVPPVQTRRRTPWLPLAAAAVFVIGIGLARVVPRTESTATPLRVLSASRAVAENVFTREEPVIAVLELPYDEAFARYEFRLRDASGDDARPSLTVEADRATRGVTLSYGVLDAGKYSVSIEGVRSDGSRQPVDVRRFTVQ